MSEIVIQGTTPGIRVSGSGAQVTVKVTTGSGGGGGGVTDHNLLTGRSDPDQHPIGAVTGLASALGSKADTASLATVATSGNYSDLSGTPSLGSAAAADTTDFAAFVHSHDITSLTTTGPDGKMPVTASGGITLVDPPSGALAVLADTTLGAAAASVQLVLPQVADADLVLSVKARGTGGTGTLQDLIMTFNSASTAAYYQMVWGTRGNPGASHAQDSTIKMLAASTDAPAGWWATNDATIHEYSTVAKHSGFIISGGHPTFGSFGQQAGLTWFMSNVSAAIVTVEFSISAMNIAAGSRFTAWARRRA